MLDKRHMTVVYEEFSKLNAISLMVFVIRVVSSNFVCHP